MPVTYRIDAESGTIETRCTGNITYQEVAVHFRELAEDPRCPPRLDVLLDLTGIETLPLRMQKHCENARAVAQHLSRHPKVSWVSYANLPNDPCYGLAQTYCPKGAGAVFTFGVRGGYEAGVKLVNAVKLFSHLANVGDTRSLIIHPASTTHRQLTDDQKTHAGAGPDVVRVSIGIEDVADIISDLDAGLAA